MPMILSGENRQIEFKREYTRNILKTVSAFSNYHDGEIIIGIDDDLNIIGVADPVSLKLNLENAINDNIIPRPYYEIHEEIMNNKVIVVLKVYLGENTPYLFNKKAYKRMDTSTVIVERHDLEALILKGRNQGYDELFYTGDNLYFDKLNIKLREQLSLGTLSKDILRTLGLIRNEKYTNGAALLSDNNPIPAAGISLIRFEGDSVAQIKDRLILRNISILEMFDRSMEFYYKHINQREIIKDAYRKTVEDVPFIAYREAVANAIVHRNYLIEADVRIEIYDNRIEVISPGGLPIGITKEEYLDGRISIIRNKIIADIFVRLGIIERLATGIRRIREYYKDYRVTPEFIILDNSITVILPSVLLGSELIEQVSERTNERIYERISERMNERVNVLSKTENKVVSYILKNGKINRTETERVLKLKKTYAVKTLNELIDKGIIVRVGSGRNTHYILRTKEEYFNERIN